MGLKTTYYLRTLGASAIEKSTLDINKSYESTPVAVVEETVTVAVEEKKPEIYVFDGEICESCQ
jgi:ribonucleoside-diphosphate reductase alpha chain